MIDHQLNVVGCGRLGRVLSKLFLQSGSIQSIRVCNRSQASAQQAVKIIGAGSAYASIAELPPSSLWMIGCGDGELRSLVEDLYAYAPFPQRCIVFHCSGALSSELLNPLRRRGALIASVHPVRSFAHVEISKESFAGTYCGVEGDPEAVAVLRELFAQIGGNLFELSPQAKLACHAGHVFASNYLVALLKSALDLYAAAGLSPDVAKQILQPLVQGTLDNIFLLGPTDALTGPIARGDSELVRQQLASVADLNPRIAQLYVELGKVALEIARIQGLSPQLCIEIDRALSR